MTEDQFKKPHISAAFLTLFATSAIMTPVLWTPTASDKASLTVPLALVIASGMFAYHLCVGRHFVYLAVAIATSVLLGSFFLHSYL